MSLVFPVGAWAAAGGGGLTPSFALDGSSGNNVAASTYVYTMVGTIAVGKLAVAAVGSGNPTLTGVVDSRGNTWAVDKTTAGSSTGAHIASAQIGTQLIAGDTITFTFSGSTNNHAAIVGAITNAKSSAALDQTGTSSATTSAPTATTGVTTQAVEMVIGCIANNDGSAVTEDANFTNVTSVTYASGARRLNMAYRTVASTGAQTYAPTQAASSATAESIATYKGA